ncbi:hypothetical protein GCT13_13360 [Paraburkholderia sp. CNPSo 3157]|uniref:Uncharacterized protein n=1 Tax=Paraburkholderia franconis TaxID=2654983 RepID=A0A7X1N9I3_9BURK|nr:hypothetical protein [Paraburkholderia franconis]MPW17898.1 hypothetical protein [Paraburkholderia franconis]
MSERAEFEQWYVENAFDLERSPIGSRECGLQWRAWQAGRRALIVASGAAVEIRVLRTGLLKDDLPALTDIDQLVSPSAVRADEVDAEAIDTDSVVIERDFKVASNA